jgi:hypothetical protein
MGGGLMQLVAYGAQDVYLTGNPQITFFKVVYRRHTNFSMESIQQTLNGSVGEGNRVTATISRNGDLVSRLYYEFDKATFKATAACANYGSAAFDYVEVEIGGQRIDKQSGHWMETYAELTEPNSGMRTHSQGIGTKGTLFQNMSGMGGTLGLATNPGAGIDSENKFPIFVPLQFWFCRNPGLALPLIALQYHEVKVITVFNTTAAGGAELDSTGINLWADYIYLDTDERRRFAQVSHEYLIEQVQHQSCSDAISMELNFNHPVKELIWTGVGSGTASPTASITTSTTLSADTYKLVLNGHDRMAARSLQYFTRTQVWQHHSGPGGMVSTAGQPKNKLADSIAVYSFALKPEEHQPSGTCNFSRIDNARLVGSGTTKPLEVYAVNYNVLRIMSGMGGLAYSN